MAPVHRIPRELLEVVFMLSQEDLFEPDTLGVGSSRTAKSRTETLAWTSVLLVCWRWYHVANTCRLLWNTLNLEDYLERLSLIESMQRFTLDDPASHWVLNADTDLDACLRRCPETLLTIRVSPQWTSPWLKKSLVCLLPRMQRLYLEPSGHRVPEIFFLQKAPYLRVLTISGDTALTDAGKNRRLSDIPDCFGGELPSLRSLAIDRSTSWPISSWPKVSLPQLTQFHQSNSTLFTLHETFALLAFLKELSMLQDLMISNTNFFGGHPPLPEGHTRARLPRLKRLTFRNVFASTDLLGYLDLPSDISLVVLGDDDSPKPVLPQLLPVNGIPSQITPLSDFYACMRSLAVGRADGIFVAGASSALWFDNFHVPTELHAPSAAFKDGMHQIAGTTEELWLTTSKEAHSEYLAQTFADILPALRKVVFLPGSAALRDGDATIQLWLKALLPQESSVPCRDLSEILICSQSPWTSLSADLCKILLDVVTQRRARSCAVTTVQFCSLCGSQDKPSCTAIDDRWLASCAPKVAALVRDIRAQLAGGVQIAVAREFPTMAVPLIARSQSGGEWRWPVWPSLTS